MSGRTSYAGIDYSCGLDNTNRDPKTGIRYGVIPQNEVLQAWADSSEPDYGEPEDVEMDCPGCGEVLTGKPGADVACEKCGEIMAVEYDDFAEPIGFVLDDGEYKATCGEDGDIFVLSSPYFTYAQFCSPCAPGACYLMSPLDEPIGNNKCFCFGADFFEDEKAPYPIYLVSTGELLFEPKKEEIGQ